MLGKEIKILLYIFSTYWKLLYKYGDLGKEKKTSKSDELHILSSWNFTQKKKKKKKTQTQIFHHAKILLIFKKSSERNPKIILQDNIITLYN